MNGTSHRFYRKLLCICVALLGAHSAIKAGAAPAEEANRIQPFSTNPYYWQYKGKPVLLLGGTDQDNLFNHPDLGPKGLESHLDLLRSVGGNYVRNTMSHRDAGNAFAFQKAGDKFDLEKWNDEYWERFDRFLRMTLEREIIVQLELWETWDFYGDHEPQGGWSRNPFNPLNNINYTAEDSRLPVKISFFPASQPTQHNFFHTVPALQDNQLVLKYQRAFIDKILSHSFKFPHVLYCINNETGEPPEWGEYWVRHVRAQAAGRNHAIEITDMRRSENLDSVDHRSIQDKPDLYSFIEVSQNNGQTRRGQNHYDPIVQVRKYIADRPRPLNNVKIYGGTGGWGGVEEGLQKFWRNIFAGCASARFHRRFPAAGVGLNETAQAHLKSARMLTDAMNVFACEPRNDFLSARDSNEAYCLAQPGKEYAVYFPAGGEVTLDASAAQGPLRVRWLDIAAGAWQKTQDLDGGTSALPLKAPGKGHWAVLVQPRREQPKPSIEGRVTPWPDNPHYLAWDGTPVFPLGPTSYHSWTPISRPGAVDFVAQLDRLAAVMKEIDSPHVCGFVRCLPYDPMNHMHDGAVNEVLQPWVKLADGRYDLERFEPAWEDRLQAFLSAALQRRIVVALEIWDDWSVTRGPGGAYDPGAGAAWNAHPFNPRNNTNYDENVLPAGTAVCDAPFYSTIPSRRNNQAVLDLQKRYVDRVLAIASGYPNVLLNISNESRAHLDWSRFWADYIRSRVPAGTLIGEMPSTNRKDGGGECEHAFSPLTLCTDGRYDFVDIAQGVSGHEFRTPRQQALGGGRRILEYRQAMARAGTERPLIVSKDYTRSSDGGDMVLWSRFVGGAAAARFHRLAGNHPESVSQFQHEAVARLGRFIAQVPFWRMALAPDLLKKLPDGAEANVLAEPAGHCVVQLIGGAEGDTLHLALTSGMWITRWINPATGRELVRSEIRAGAETLEVPIPAGSDHRILHVQKQGDSRSDRADNRIQPWAGNPRYWQHKGRPILLLGGSKDDNLFQIPDLREHLDAIRAAGGNFIRNTMSDRLDHGFEVHPFNRQTDGKFDHEQWNEEYWQRFENLLRWTAERDIIVQIELWDMWDMHADNWKRNPWNPANNVNYTHDNTRLAADYAPPQYRNGTSHGQPHDFFLSVPALGNDRLLLSFQRRFIDKVLSYSLRFDHVLYCVSNEIHPQYPPEWGWFWAKYLQEQASSAGRRVEVTEMYWSLDLRAEQHRASLDRPEVYSFFEASQNSGTLNPEEHWRNLQFIYQHLNSWPRPINNTKIYGADGGAIWAGSTQNAQEKFWRNIFGGSASSRFHRPPTGLGLSEAARVHVKSLRMLTDSMNVFVCEPRNDLLSERAPNEAYCLAEPGRQYAVYFPDAGEVKLEISGAKEPLTVRWLEIRRSAWQEPHPVAGNRPLTLKTPGKGAWAALIRKSK